MAYKKIKLTPMSGGSVLGSEKIRAGKKYRVVYDGDSYIGSFSRQWYGLSFNGIFPSGISLKNILLFGGKVQQIINN